MLELLLAGVICGADQILKHRIDAAKDSELDRPVAGGKVIVTRFHNDGAVLGFLGDRKPLLALLSGTGAAALIYSLGKAVIRKEPLIGRIGLSLAAGGAASNLFDRVAHGRVTDYFRLTFLGRRMKNVIFNLGDFAIFAGAGLHLAGILKKAS